MAMEFLLVLAITQLLTTLISAGTPLPTGVTSLVTPINLAGGGAAQFTLPLVPGSAAYLLDLNGDFLASDCFHQRPIKFGCSSSRCARVKSGVPRTTSCPITCKVRDNECTVTPRDPFTGQCPAAGAAALTYTDITLTMSKGPVRTSTYSFPHFLSSCVPYYLTKLLPGNTNGVAGLGRTEMALPDLLADWTGHKHQFALCLPESTSKPGVAFFGNGPYHILPRTDGSSLVKFVPLVSNPTRPSSYYVPLRTIAVSGSGVSVNGGTKLSTTVPYTTLATPIYLGLVNAFKKGLTGARLVQAVKPFGVCFTSGSAKVPNIDLVMSNGVRWTVTRDNSVKQVSNGVSCLAFVDGGKGGDASVVIGSYQLQGVFALFDLERMMVGLSMNLRSYGSSCSNYYG